MVTASTCWACAPCAASLRHSARSRRPAGLPAPVPGHHQTAQPGRGLPCLVWPLSLDPAGPPGPARMHRCLYVNAVNAGHEEHELTRCSPAIIGGSPPGPRLAAVLTVVRNRRARTTLACSTKGASRRGSRRRARWLAITTAPPMGAPRNSSLTVQMHGCRSPALRRTDVPAPLVVLPARFGPSRSAAVTQRPAG